jgi:hypothetical protein
LRVKRIIEMHYLKNPFVLAILGGVIVGVAIALNFMLRDDDVIEPRVSETTEQQSTQTATNIITESPEVETTESSSEQSTQSSSIVVEPQQEITETQEEEEQQQEAPVHVKPSFDVVRITTDGHAVIAGQAEPGSTIKVFLDDQLLGTAKADKHGEWVFVPSKPLLPGTQGLTLHATSPNGFVIKSEQNVVVNVPERDGQDDTQSFAVALSQEINTPTQVLQKPGELTTSLLSIDAIDYNDDGEFSITGTAKANSMVNLYLDNTYIGTSRTSDTGQWYILPEMRVKPGQYELRADQVDDRGEVLERITMPFMRDEMKPDINPDTFYVVQPGNSLWRIARRAYGEGLQYTVIYVANKDQIGNPDLIYPGQIFSLPLSN